MIEFKPTTGVWSVVDNGIWDISITSNGTVCHLSNKGEWFPSGIGSDLGRSHRKMLADANLIAEAGTVYHETGLTPREILAQRDELLEALGSLVKEGTIKNKQMRYTIARIKGEKE